MTTCFSGFILSIDQATLSVFAHAPFNQDVTLKVPAAFRADNLASELPVGSEVRFNVDDDMNLLGLRRENFARGII